MFTVRVGMRHVGLGGRAGSAALSSASLEASAYARAMNLDKWERRTEWPMTALAVIFLAVYAVPILHPDRGACDVGCRTRSS